MYLKEFEVRWSDIDANGHLANSAYLHFMSHTRMSYMMEHGLGLRDLQQLQLGPVVFHENVFYFRELFLGDMVRVSLQLRGLSADGMFFEFLHNLYNKEGINSARCIISGAWINIQTRKLTPLPAHILERLGAMQRTPDFREISREDTRKEAQTPVNLPVQENGELV